ncbi:hypothetical protein SUGI_0522770 [Cryptomeria japonica]|nr:hypothetical protein SUGI_0522770 [Cryptomeria japonica]
MFQKKDQHLAAEKQVSAAKTAPTRVPEWIAKGIYHFMLFLKMQQSPQFVMINMRQIAGSTGVLEEMSIMGHNPTAGSRDLLVNGMLTAGNVDKEFVTKMTDDGFVPNLQTFNIFLESLSNALGK